MAKIISTSRDQTRAIFLTLDRLRWLLSIFVTPGLNEEMDQLCYETMGIPKSFVSVGLLGYVINNFLFNFFRIN